MASTKERVTHLLDPTAASHIPLFLPRIGVIRGIGGEEDEVQRPALPSDVDRVMDYPHMPEPPGPGVVMHCEAPGSGIDDDADDEIYDGFVSFPKRAARLAGGYIFLSKPQNKDNTAGNNAGGKIACVPLQGCEVELPPGGRRVFREHAHTGARKGYEMAIHVRHGDNSEKMTCHIVLTSLGEREAWSAAIKMRCDVGNKYTILRPGGLAGSRLMGADEAYYQQEVRAPPPAQSDRGRPSHGQKKKPKQWGLRPQEGPASSGNADLDAAIEQFGVHGFNEEKWVQEFLRKHSMGELTVECDRLEKWMDVIKNGLRGAVLEQYEYFVEASREMSTMGREVAWIRTLVERQQETLMSMRNIDFGSGFDDGEEGAGDEEYGYLSEEDGLMDTGNDSDASSVASSSSEEESSPAASRTPMRANVRNRRRESRKSKVGIAPTVPLDEQDGPPAGGQSSSIEIPPWIIDVTEEVSAFIKESRYSDATELILKARGEVSNILAANEPPTSIGTRGAGSTTPLSSSPTGSPKKLHKKQQAFLQRTDGQLDALMDRMSKRLAENLRRKNEALKASAKRERADPLSNLAPLVSPVCLNDDAVALHLLVKLGRYQEAATAYAARRSLLLSEW